MSHSRRLLALAALALLAIATLAVGTGTLGTSTSRSSVGGAEASADELTESGASAESATTQIDGDAAENTDGGANTSHDPQESSADETSQRAASAENSKDTPAGPKPSTGKEKYDLRYHFKAGEVVRWEIEHRAAVDSTIQGTNQTAKTYSKSVKCWEVTKVTRTGEITIEHSVESVDMWQKMQGRDEVKYNSQTDAEAPQGYESVAEAVGVLLTVTTIDDRGNVVKRDEKKPQPNAKSALFTVPLPAEPVAIGHKWSAPLDVEAQAKGEIKKIQTRQLYTLEKVVDGVATIAVDSQVLTPVNDPAIEAQLIGALTAGSLKFDIEAGRFRSQQLDLDRRVVGFSGPSSSMHYLMRFTEELLPAETKPVAKKAPPTKTSPPITQRPVPPGQPATAQKLPAAVSSRPGQPVRKGPQR